jgi:hypothetical protein
MQIVIVSYTPARLLSFAAPELPGSDCETVAQTGPSIQRENFSALRWCHLSRMPVALDLCKC